MAVSFDDLPDAKPTISADGLFDDLPEVAPTIAKESLATLFDDLPDTKASGSLRPELNGLVGIPSPTITPERIGPQRMATALAQKQAEDISAFAGLNQIEQDMAKGLYAVHKAIGKPPPTREEIQSYVASEPLHESVVGIAPENVDLGQGPITGWLTAIGKGATGLGQFMTSPSGMVQQLAAMTPAKLLVVGKWFYDMAKGSGESAAKLAELIAVENPTPEQQQQIREEIINTAIMAGGAILLGYHGFKTAEKAASDLAPSGLGLDAKQKVSKPLTGIEDVNARLRLAAERGMTVLRAYEEKQRLIPETTKVINADTTPSEAGVTAGGAKTPDASGTKPPSPPETPPVAEAKPEVIKIGSDLNPGDRIDWVPNESERRYQSPISGMVSQVLPGSGGGFRVDVLAPLPGDPSRIVSVWDNRGRITRTARADLRPQRIPVYEQQTATQPRLKTATEIADEIAARGIDPQASYGEFVKARDLKPEISAKEWLPIYRKSLELAKLNKKIELSKRVTEPVVAEVKGGMGQYQTPRRTAPSAVAQQNNLEKATLEQPKTEFEKSLFVASGGKLRMKKLPGGNIQLAMPEDSVVAVHRVMRAYGLLPKDAFYETQKIGADTYAVSEYKTAAASAETLKQTGDNRPSLSPDEKMAEIPTAESVRREANEQFRSEIAQRKERIDAKTDWRPGEKRRALELLQESESILARSETPKTLSELAAMDVPDTPTPAKGLGSRLRQKFEEGDKRSGEAGFIDLSILKDAVDLGKRLFKSGMSFAEWSARMIKAAGDGIAGYLGAVWKKVNPLGGGGEPGPYVRSAVQRSVLIALRGRAGALPDSFRTLVRNTTAARSAIEERLDLMVKDAHKAMLAEYPKDFEAGVKALSDFMEGRAPVTDLRGTFLQQRAAQIRNYIDSLSQAIADMDVVSPGLKAVIENNLGEYLRRNYLAFDRDAKWTYDELTKRAASGDKEAGRIFNQAKTFLEKEFPKASPGEIEAMMRSLTDRTYMQAGMEGVLRGSGFGGDRIGANITSLFKRKDIPVEIREWMGEVTDPFHKSVATGKWMAQFIARQEAQQQMADIGVKSGLFSTEKTGRYTEQLYPNEVELVPRVDPATGEPVKIPGGVEAEYRTRTQRRYYPLRELYTTKELFEAIKEFEKVDSGMPSVTSAALNAYLKLVGLTKKGQVALNPFAYPVNIAGGMFMNLASGTWKPEMYKRAIAAITIGDKATADVPGALRKQAREDFLLAARAGVLDAGVLQSELRAILERTRRGTEVEGATKRLIDMLQKGKRPDAVQLWRALKDLSDQPGEMFIAKPDNVMRVANFLTQMDLAKRAFPKMETEARVQWAADRASNIYQTYERVWLFFRGLSQLGALNTYVTFKLELMRNMFWIARYAAQDMASGNPALVRNGAKMAAALTAMAVGPMLLSSLTREQAGLSEQQEDDMRVFLPKWDQNEVLFHVDYKDGRFSYAPMSYLLPHTEFLKIVNAGFVTANSDDISGHLGAMANSFANDYLGPSSVAAPTIEAISGRRLSGGNITLKEGAEGAMDRVNYWFAATVIPRVFPAARDAWRGFTGEPGDWGKLNRPEDVMLKSVAIRVRNVDVEQRLPFLMARLASRWRDASQVANAAEKRYAAAPEKIESETQYSESAKEQLKAEYKRTIAAAQRLGVDSATILAIEKQYRIPSELRGEDAPQRRRPANRRR